MNILITGATKGIGRAIAEKFAAEGYDLAVCARTTSDLDQMKSEFEQRFPEIDMLTMSVDVADKKALTAFAGFVKNRWQRLDVLVNNAGLFLSGKVHEEPDGLLEELMAINLYGAYHLTRQLLPLMLPFRAGHIFNMCSIASLVSYPNGGAYTITKFAMLGFNKCLREEMKKEGIRVTAILPGATWSDSWAGATHPADRLMRAEDIALAVWSAHLMHPSAVVEEILIRPQLGDL